MALITKEFAAEEIAMKQIYSDFDSDYRCSKFNFTKIDQIYGTLKFPEVREERPLLLGCFVSAIDGTIAFKDNPKSGQIARNKQFDANVGQADLWVLNLLRAAADGIILGPKTLQTEENLTGHIFDPELIKARSKLLNKPQIPYNIIVSKTGQSIPYQHRIFSENEIPLMIATSPQGAQYIKKRLISSYEIINLDSKQNSDLNKKILAEDQVIILVTGQDYDLDDETLFKFFKKCGLDKLIVETPSYAHYLIKQQLLDEIFLNQVGLYIGGPKFLNNDFDFSFSSDDAPHTKTVTIHTYNSYFFCFRYRLVYSNISE